MAAKASDGVNLNPEEEEEEPTYDGVNDNPQRISIPVMNESWLGKPVEEIDPMIFEDTFCVITKKFGRHHIYRYSSSKALYLLGPLNPIRKVAIYVTTHRLFDFLIVLTILCNCVTLGTIANDPDGKITVQTDTQNSGIGLDAEHFVDYVEYVFLMTFSIEMILKILAKGMLLHKFAYLRNRWNLLDFAAVVSGFVALIMDVHDNDNEKEKNQLDFLRTFRILRVFKTFSILPGLKMMINALLNAVVQLLEVMGLIVVSLMIFTSFAMELFQGRLRQKCVIDKGGPMDPDRLIHQPISQETIENRDRVWTEWVNNWRNWQRRDFPGDEPVFCGNGTGKRACEEGHTCIGHLGDNPDSGWTSFDSFFNAMLSTFQLLTLDYWERLYDILMSTCGFWSLLFLLLVIFLGAYYLLNLMLAVVALSYESEVSAEEHHPVSTTEKLDFNRQASNFSFDELTKLNICKMTDYRKRTNSERTRLAKRLKLLEEDLDRESITGQGQGRLDDAIFNIMGLKLTLNQGNDRGRRETFGQAGGDLPRDQKNSFPYSDPVAQSSTLEVEADEQAKRSRSAMLNKKSEVEISASQKIPSPWTQVTPSAMRLTYRLSDYIRHFLRPVVNHPFFENFITFCIIANTIVLASEHHDNDGRSKELGQMLSLFNYIFTGVFTVEAVLKLMALQGEYFNSGWNIFDIVIVVVSYFDFIVELIYKETSSKSIDTSNLSVIRSLRLLRIFKLAQSWVTMKVLLNIVFASFGALGNLICVLLIIIYIFAVMGMQVIGKTYTYAAFDAVKDPSEFPAWNWQHFWYAFNLVFRVLCGEWVEVLWECLQAQRYEIETVAALSSEEDSGGGHYFYYGKCFLIYIPIIIVGQFIVLNLFLALLLNSFDTAELNAQREKELEASGKAENMKNIVGLLMKKESIVSDSDGINESEIEMGGHHHGHIKPARNALFGSMDVKQLILETSAITKNTRKSMIVESRAKRRFKDAVIRVIMKLRTEAAERAIARMENRRRRSINEQTNNLFLGNPAMRAEGNHYDQTPPSSVHSEAQAIAGECFPVHVCRYRFCPCRPIRRRSIAVVYRWEKLRSVCVSIVGHSVFEGLILTLIFASSITLCFEDINLDSRPKLFRDTLRYVSYAFTAVFCVEMILKWFAIGLWSYFTSFWTILDAFIVVVSLVSMYFDLTLDATSSTKAGNLGALKALRTLRALRPLRAISRWQGMKIVVNALFYAIPSIFNVLLVCLLFWLIFAIMGVQFFKGTFYRCVDQDGEAVTSVVVPNKDVCCAKASTHGYSWVNTISNYDNVFEAYLSLLQIATYEGWMELMEASVNAVGVDMQPIPDNQIEVYGFYVVFIVFGAFFALRLFIGVIIDNFNMLKKKYEGNMLEMLLTPSQRNYYIAMKNLGKKRPKPIIQRPKNKLAGFFYHLATSKMLEVIIFAMIFLNMVMESVEHYGMSYKWKHVLQGCGSFFTTIYFLEALIKVVGMGTFYFTIPWNVYDFILMAASTLDTFVGISVSLPFQPTMLRVVRVFRIGRILRPIKAAKGLRKLMFALVISLPALFNIGALLSLVTFIYAILGMNLFGNAPRKWSVDDVFNFETFLRSNLMLLRLMTAAGWNEVLDSLTVLEPICGTYRHLECGQPGEPECPNRPLVVAYVVSYVCITFLIILNLYVAVILENFVDSSNEEDVGIVDDDMEMFYIRWSRFDPFATQFINFDDLPDFLESLDPPLQFRKPNIMAIVAFNLPIARGNKLHCLDILQTLIIHVLGHAEDSPEFRKLQRQMEHKFQKQFPTRRLLEIVSNSRRWKIKQNAAIIIQRAWRQYWRRTHQAPRKTMKTTNATLANNATSGIGIGANAKSQHGGLGHMMSRVGNVLSKKELDDSSVHQAKSEGTTKAQPHSM